MKYMNEKFYTVRGYEMKDSNKNTLTSSMEDYLEMIYRRCQDNSYLRINNLAHLLNVNDSSATKMVQKLGQLGFVNYEKYGIITLTEKGYNLGKMLLSRHSVLENFLTFIGCTEDALKQTELIEHNINWDTIKKLQILYDFFNENKDVLERLEQYIKTR